MGQTYPSSKLANDTHAGIVHHGSILSNGRDAMGDFLKKVLYRILALPGERVLERATKVAHCVGENGNVVTADGISVKDHGKADTLGTVVVVVPCRHASSTVRLAQANLEAEDGDTDTEKGKEVRDEELKTVVVVHD